MTDDSNNRKKDRQQLEEMAPVKSSVIYEAIRREGDHELSRTFNALWWSGVAAGLAISTSVMCKGFLEAVLPHEDWTPAVSNLGYAVGFLIVILGRMQLFTENTMTPMLSLFLNPSMNNLGRTARLWGIVFAANMTGCLIAAGLLVIVKFVPDPQYEGILAVSRHYAEATALQHLLWGMPAGFLVATLVWVLPTLEGAGEVLMILILTYIIGLGGLSHVVAGSTEYFILMFLGDISINEVIFSGILPAFIGNVIGGTGMFAALTYAQVRKEI